MKTYGGELAIWLSISGGLPVAGPAGLPPPQALNNKANMLFDAHTVDIPIIPQVL